jgi:hypothetical protein
MSSEKEFSLEMKPKISQELTFTDVDLQKTPSNMKKGFQAKTIIIGASVLILVIALIFCTKIQFLFFRRSQLILFSFCVDFCRTSPK